MRTGSTRSRRSVGLVLVAATVAAVLAVLVVPAPLQTPGTGSGDAALLADLRHSLPPTGHHAVAAAVVDGPSSRTAALGPVGAETPMRVESVTKVLTGMLLADAVDRGELTPQTTLGEVFDRSTFADPSVADITVTELATHTSGLGPRLPAAWWQQLLPTVFGGPLLLRQSPVEVARETSGLASRGRFDYSNLGMALLGQTLAARTGTDLPELARQRLLEPLGMRHTSLSGPPPGAARGHDPLGRPVADPRARGWEGAGFAGYSSAGDLARLLSAVAQGRAPGQRAVEEVTGEMGLGWVQGELGGRPVVLHSGGAAGASAFVAVEPGGRGVAVIGDSPEPVGPAAARLLDADPLPGDTGAAGAGPLGATLVLLSAALVLGSAVGLGRARTVLGAVTAAVAALAGVLLAWNLLPPGVGWQVLWVLLAALTGGSLAAAATAPRRPAPARRWWAHLLHGLALLVCGALLVAGTSSWW